jgi:hypothetical protein
MGGPPYDIIDVPIDMSGIKWVDGELRAVCFDLGGESRRLN